MMLLCMLFFEGPVPMNWVVALDAMISDISVRLFQSLRLRVEVEGGAWWIES